jgi:methylated-DNA-[protein]-cysteine S-methyltransferase
VTEFQKKVYHACSLIPSGKVTTYAQIAQFIGCKSSRAVGSALHRNPKLITIPCHRVVAWDGSLVGYVNGIEKKKQLLLSEGVTFTKNKVTQDCIVGLS